MSRYPLVDEMVDRQLDPGGVVGLDDPRWQPVAMWAQAGMVGLDEDQPVRPRPAGDLGRIEDARHERDPVSPVLGEDLERPTLAVRLVQPGHDDDGVAGLAGLELEPGRHLVVDRVA